MTRRSEAQWRKLIDKQALSDSSASEFCGLRSVSPKVDHQVFYFSFSHFGLPENSVNQIITHSVQRF